MALKTRLKRLEDASERAGNGHKIAMITYVEAEQTKAEAIAVWEAENGPLSDCLAAFFTSYETRPVAS